MHENHASIVALHRLKTFFKKSADTFASTQYKIFNMLDLFHRIRNRVILFNVILDTILNRILKKIRESNRSSTRFISHETISNQNFHMFDFKF